MAKLETEAPEAPASGSHAPPLAEPWPEVDFRALVASVRDYAIFMLNPQGVIASWNEGAARIKGYSAAEIIGKHFSIFYPPEIVKTGICEYELTVSAAEGRFEVEGYRIHKDATHFWANVDHPPTRQHTGERILYANV